MNAGKLNTLKYEMNRLHVDNLDISELKWPGIGQLCLTITSQKEEEEE